LRRAADYIRNAEKIKARVSAYGKANPDKERERSARRYAAKLQRTLTLTKDQKTALKAIYSFAEWVSKKTGSQHHVDHIVPLKGENMSGLHVPWNLRVISAKENLMKKNKVDDSISMPTCMNGRNRQC
jgi:5-methylcytosine-specific restriction endonuclease McrA